jgi:transcriptional regulator with XRE-family HTH domain
MTEQQYLVKVGKRIRRIRKEKNISLNTMVEKTGFARSNLSHIEYRGQDMKLTTLKVIADVLKCDVKDFL